MLQTSAVNTAQLAKDQKIHNSFSVNFEGASKSINKFLVNAGIGTTLTENNVT
jgi:hypothetical protein